MLYDVRFVLQDYYAKYSNPTKYSGEHLDFKSPDFYTDEYGHPRYNSDAYLKG